MAPLSDQPISEDIVEVSTKMHEADAPFSGKEDANISRFLRECFAEVLDPSLQSSDAAMTTLMDHYLEQPVVLEPQIAREPGSVLAHVTREISAQAGCSVKKCLLDPNSPVSLLTQIKDRYQRTAKKGQREADRRVATVVCFGAIASALVFRREKISSYSYRELKDAISKLHDKTWIDPALMALFKRASQVLSESTNAWHGSPPAK
jgi:hypothetical protein